MKLKHLIGIFLLVIALELICFGVYTLNSSKYIFKTSFSGVMNKTIDSYVEISNKFSHAAKYEKYKLSTLNTVREDEIEYVLLKGDIYADTVNQTMYLNLDSKLLQQDFLGIETGIYENKLYIKLKEAMDKFYYIDFNSDDMQETLDSIEEIDTDKLLNLKKDELRLFSDLYKKSLLNDLDNKDFVRNKEKIKLDNKEVTMTKVSLKISEKKNIEILIRFFEELKNNEKAIETLKKVYTSFDEKIIDEAITSLKEELTHAYDDQGIIVSFYVERFNSLRRIEFKTFDDEENNNSIHSSVEIDMFNNKFKHKTTIIRFDLMGEKASFKFEKVNANQVNIEAMDNETVAITGTYKNTETITELSLKWELIGTMLNYKYTVVNKDEEYKVDLYMATDGTEINSSNILTLNEDVPDIDKETSIPFDEVSDEEIASIERYIQRKLIYFGFIEEPDYDELSDNDPEKSVNDLILE